MAIALLAGANGHFIAQGTIDTVTSTAINTTGATLLVLVTNYVIGAPPTVSDSKSNTWILADDQGSGVVGTAMYYAQNPTVGSGHTFTSAATGSAPAIAGLALSGTLTSSVLDQAFSNPVAATTSVQSGNILPAENNEILIYSLSAYERTSTAAVDSGFTISDQAIIIGGVSLDIALAYLIQTTATNVNPTWAWTTSSTALVIIADFKEGTAGSSNIAAVGPVTLANLSAVGPVAKASIAAVGPVSN